MVEMRFYIMPVTTSDTFSYDMIGIDLIKINFAKLRSNKFQMIESLLKIHP